MEKDTSNIKTTGSDTSEDVMYLVYHYDPITSIRNPDPIIGIGSKEDAYNFIKKQRQRIDRCD